MSDGVVGATFKSHNICWMNELVEIWLHADVLTSVNRIEKNLVIKSGTCAFTAMDWMYWNRRVMIECISF